MSVSPNETAGAAHGETPPTAPAALSESGVSTTVIAFIVFIAAWIGAKLTAFSVPVDGADRDDLSLLQLALFLLAGAAAIVTGRALKPVPRSVFIVLTALYCVASGLIPIADLAGEAPVADIGHFTALAMFVFLADLLYPLIVAAALTVTVSRVTPAAEQAEDAEAQDAEAEDAKSVRRWSTVRRSGMAAAFVLIAAIVVMISVWFLRQPELGASALWSAGDVVNAIAAVVGTVAAVFAIRCLAVSRTLPRPEPVVGPRSNRAHSRLAWALTFLALAGGLRLSLTSTATVGGFPVEVGGGFPIWALSMSAFAIGGLGLGLVTLGAVTSRLPDSRAAAA